MLQSPRLRWSLVPLVFLAALAADGLRAPRQQRHAPLARDAAPSPCPQWPEEAAELAAIERKFELLDAYTRANGNPDFHDRKWGIASLALYAQNKTTFVFRALRKRFAPTASPVICELGFNAGHSSMLMLEALPRASVVSFDLGDFAWSANERLFSRVYGARFEFVRGDSAVTLPNFAHLSCEVLFIDGSKDTDARAADVRNFRAVARPGALLLLDEVSSEACVRGKISEAECVAAPHSDYAPTSIAYHRLSREGVIRVDECIETITKGDGFCSATLL